MIVLTYIGILLFCYGIYHMLCYVSMLSTLASSRKMTSYGQKQTICYNNALLIALAEKIVKKWGLEWNSFERMAEILHYSRIYYSMTVYCISLILTVLSGLFLCSPLLFWNTERFWVMVMGFFVVVLADPVIFLHRYKKRVSTDKPEVLATKNRNKWRQKCIRLLPGVFFICQIILLMAMLT